MNDYDLRVKVDGKWYTLLWLSGIVTSKELGDAIQKGRAQGRKGHVWQLVRHADDVTIAQWDGKVKS